MAAGRGGGGDGGGGGGVTHSLLFLFVLLLVVLCGVVLFLRVIRALDQHVPEDAAFGHIVALDDLFEALEVRI